MRIPDIFKIQRDKNVFVNFSLICKLIFFYFDNTLKVANYVNCFNTIVFWFVKLILFTKTEAEQI